ncbi:hypothetical protein ACFLZK_00865 [Patescibacteria group bacterium]
MSGIKILYIIFAIVSIILYFAKQPFIKWRNRETKKNPVIFKDEKGNIIGEGVDDLHCLGGFIYWGFISITLIIMVVKTVIYFLKDGTIFYESIALLSLYLIWFLLREYENEPRNKNKGIKKVYSIRGILWLVLSVFMVPAYFLLLSLGA